MSTAIEKTKQQVATIRTTLIKSRGQIAQALPRHMDVDRLLRVIMTSVQRTPELLECSTISLLGAVIQTAQLGLEPDNVVGEAYLLPFKKRVQLIPGYKGLVKLARNSGQISSITAEVVYRQDKYTFAKGLAEKLEHIPSQDPDPRSDKDIVAFYCIVRLKDGGVQWEWMWRWEVDTIRNSSPGKGASGPWVTHYA
ncbi:MAG: recombinase RecT, partial [Acidobacteriota bacterium]